MILASCWTCDFSKWVLGDAGSMWNGLLVGRGTMSIAGEVWPDPDHKWELEVQTGLLAWKCVALQLLLITVLQNLPDLPPLQAFKALAGVHSFLVVNEPVIFDGCGFFWFTAEMPCRWACHLITLHQMACISQVWAGKFATRLHYVCSCSCVSCCGLNVVLWNVRIRCYPPNDCWMRQCVSIMGVCLWISGL